MGGARHVRREQLAAAFLVNLALWAVFVIMDEVFLAFLVPGFNIMETHRSLFTANLVSLMAIHLLPNT